MSTPQISNPHRRTGRVAFVHAPSRRHEGPKTLLDLLRSSHLETIPPAQLIESLGSTKAEPLEDSFWSGGKRFATAVGLKDGEKGIVINGRVRPISCRFVNAILLISRNAGTCASTWLELYGQ
jgi:hypothetical protein